MDETLRNIHKLRAKVEVGLGKRDNTDTWVIPIADAKICYVPIPKAANTSMRYALLPLLGLQQAQIENIHRDSRIPKLKSSTFLRDYESEWFVFTVVRNPVERAFSAYKNKLLDPVTPFRRLAQMGLKSGDSFETFLTALKDWPEKALNDHFLPQTVLLSRFMAKSDISIFKLEQAEQWWDALDGEVSARCGVHLDRLKNLNATHQGTRKDLSRKEKALIEDLYSEDFDAFDYSL